ncbi:MAG TPA: hypothetical protein PKZ22_08255 [Accumulibacter sp.]|nr:hypothetical protein [Accumulibacter sp.]
MTEKRIETRDDHMKDLNPISREVDRRVPPWVTAISAEFRLGVVLPLAFLILASVIIYWIYGWGRDFRLAVGLLWCVFAVIFLCFTFILMIATSVASDLIDNTPSTRSPFSDFYNRAASLTGWRKNLLLALGFLKVFCLVVGGVVLLGGLWTVWLGLSSGSYFKVRR